MKRCIISDLHFGIKKSNAIFLESQLRFFNNQLFPYLKEHEIKDIDILGDLFDTRVAINVSLQNEIQDLFDRYSAFNFRIIVGNHDLFYNSRTDINSLKWLMKFPHIEIINNITEKLIDGKTILYVPWIIDEKEFENYLITQNKKYDCIMGHMHLNGFFLNKVTASQEGLNALVFNKYTDKVYSGHFHRQSTTMVGNTAIQYMGSPYQLTRADMDEARGFHILDTTTMTTEFIENVESMKFKVLDYPQEFNEEFIRGNVVDVFVNYDTNRDDVEDDKIQVYIKKIEEFGPSFPPNLKVLNDCVQVDIDGIDLSKVKSTEDLVREYIGSTEIENKEDILTIMLDLYNECRKES